MNNMRKHRSEQGVALLECLIYFAICMMLAGMLIRFFLQGMHAASLAGKMQVMNREAQMLLVAVRGDLKQARSVLLPGMVRKSLRADWPQGTCVAIRRADSRRVFYVCSDRAVYRCQDRNESGTSRAGSMQVRGFAGKFTSLRVAPMTGAARVFRIDLAMPLDYGILHTRVQQQPRIARYATAVQVRCGEGR